MTQFIINQIASQIVRIVNQTQLIQWLQHVKSQVCCCQNLSIRLSEKVPNFIFSGVRKESINLQALVTRSNPIQLNPSGSIRSSNSDTLILQDFKYAQVICHLQAVQLIDIVQWQRHGVADAFCLCYDMSLQFVLSMTL